MFGLGINFPALPTEALMKLTVRISVSVLFWRLIRGCWFSRLHNSPVKWRGSSQREQLETPMGYVAGSWVSPPWALPGFWGWPQPHQVVLLAQASVLVRPGPVFLPLPLPSRRQSTRQGGAGESFLPGRAIPEPWEAVLSCLFSHGQWQNNSCQEPKLNHQLSSTRLLPKQSSLITKYYPSPRGARAALPAAILL